MNFGNLSEAQNAVHEGKHCGIFKTGTVSQGCFPMKQPSIRVRCAAASLDGKSVSIDCMGRLAFLVRETDEDAFQVSRGSPSGLGKLVRAGW